VTFEYLAWATVWLLVGTTAALIGSIKLHWPEFLPYARLSFGWVRPAPTNLVLFGWSSLAPVGLALYVVSRPQPRARQLRNQARPVKSEDVRARR
jgi:cytochrome c oxidase cbb3-type subunit 1